MTSSDEETTQGATPRIDVRRALKVLVLALVLPVGVAVLLDLTTGLLPILTIVAALICIPLATILVNRTVLAEMDRVIALVAPVPVPVAEEGHTKAEMGEVAPDAKP